MINCNFVVPFKINRPKLQILLKTDDYNAEYDSNGHAGVKIRYVSIKQKITIFVFESGSIIIILGNQGFSRINEVYTFIYKYLLENYDVIVKDDNLTNSSILKYLETVNENASKWYGDCFVFDQRVAVAVDHAAEGRAENDEEVAIDIEAPPFRQDGARARMHVDGGGGGGAGGAQVGGRGVQGGDVARCPQRGREADGERRAGVLLAGARQEPQRRQERQEPNHSLRRLDFGHAGGDVRLAEGRVADGRE